MVRDALPTLLMISTLDEVESSSSSGEDPQYPSNMPPTRPCLAFVMWRLPLARVEPTLDSRWKVPGTEGE